jgi:phenylacetate-CoA ligase
VIRQLAALRQVLRDATLNGDALRALVHARLRTVLESACRDVPYYRECMRAAGYDPLTDYRGPEDLRSLPITTKQVLKEQGALRFVQAGANLDTCFRDSTSGSTGIPLVIYRDEHARAIQIAKWLRVLFLNGYSVFDKVLSITGPTRLSEGRSVLQKFGLLRRMPLDYRLPPEAMTDALLAYKPDVLYGGRSFLEMMCLEMERRNTRPAPVKLLVATNEMVRQASRDLFRRYFGVELTESYGSVEMGVLAFEAPERQGLRLCEDLTYYEFLDDQGNPVPPGGIGRVVVTDLTGTLMPFIRYDQGDRAEHQEVPDSRGLPRRVIRRILGRDDDYVVLPDGRRTTFDAIYEIVDEYHGIHQFRIIQRSRTLFHVQVVAERTYLSSVGPELTRRLQSVLFPEARYEVIAVDRIEADPNGKTRIFISEIA